MARGRFHLVYDLCDHDTLFAVPLLNDTMFAYAGTYSVDAGKVIHHVDISWNEAWTGTDQIRLFEVNGNVLTLTTYFPDPASDVEALYAVVWEKVTSPR